MSLPDAIPLQDGFTGWLRRALVLGPVGYGIAVAYIVARRLTYPFELEWLEGGSLLQVLRLLQGEPLYSAPGLSYIAFNYPPLYYYVSTVMAWLTGIHSFATLRTVSLISALGTALLIFSMVRRETSSAFWGVISAGLFVAGFRVGGYWYDIARIDMLFVLLLIAGTYTLVRGGRYSGLVAGILFALSFYTKQSALVPVAAAAAWVLVCRDWRTALLLGIAFSLLSGALIVLENQITHGWYVYYVFHLPSLHHFPSPLWAVLFSEAAALLGVLGIALVIGMLPLVLAPRGPSQANHALLAIICLAAIAVSVVGNAEPAGFENANLPAVATIPIVAGLGGHWLESSGRLKNSALLRSAVYVLLALQFALLAFAVEPQIPTQADEQAGKQLVASLRDSAGAVLVPYHPYLAMMAGKEPSAHQVMLWVLSGNFGSEDAAQWPQIEAEIKDTLRMQAASRILLDRPDAVWTDVSRYYLGEQISYPNRDDFYPVTGGRGRPNLDFVPR